MGKPTPEERAIERQVALWDAINAYAVACGADPSRHVYGNTPRQRAVAEIGHLIRAAEQEAAAGVWEEAAARIQRERAESYEKGSYDEVDVLDEMADELLNNARAIRKGQVLTCQENETTEGS